MKNEYSISSLSPHLFWDVDIASVDWQSNKAFIVERVMDYGELKDWGILKSVYGLKAIKEVAISLRNLDGFSIAFLSLVLNVKKEAFRCYRLKQSRPDFWSY